MTNVNPWLAATVAPPIPEVASWRREYSGELGAMLDLSQAVPARPPPELLIEQLAKAALEPEAARYGDDQGDPKLRQVFANHVNGIYGSHISAEHLLITSGCNQAFFQVAIALAKAGEVILLPEPYYFNHRMTLDMLGIQTQPIRCRAENGFMPDLDEIEALLKAGAKALALVSPNNPTGAVYPATLLDSALACCQQYGAALILDETYRDFLPEGLTRPHELLACNDWPTGLVQLYSFSKAYCIPGYRLGAVTASPELIQQLMKIQDSMQICAPRIGQMALAHVIDSLGSFRAEQRDLVNQRAVRFRQIMQDLPHWQLDSIGAFFAFVRSRDNRNSTEVARALARDAGILCLPADFFGPEPSPYLRLAFANVSEADIEEVGRRLMLVGI